MSKKNTMSTSKVFSIVNLYIVFVAPVLYTTTGSILRMVVIAISFCCSNKHALLRYSSMVFVARLHAHFSTFD